MQHIPPSPFGPSVSAMPRSRVVADRIAVPQGIRCDIWCDKGTFRAPGRYGSNAALRRGARLLCSGRAAMFVAVTLRATHRTVSCSAAMNIPY